MRVGLAESATLIVKVELPIAVGVPLIASDAVVLPFSVRPAGSVPTLVVQV